MTDSRRLAYLEALGVDVYVRRGLEPLPEPAAAPVEAPRAVPESAAVVIERGPEANLDWEPLRGMVAACTRCALHETRTQTVFGVGNPRARWMFIGEAPGAEEDRQGEPFVGRAGQLLNSMIKALGLGREDVYIANVLKCRPPGNRDPKEDEVAPCAPYLDQQIELIAPRILVALGKPASHRLTGTAKPISALRGRWASYKGIPLMPLFHPAYLLRNELAKREAWEDLKKIKQRLDSITD